MAGVDVSGDVPLNPQDAWTHVSNLSTLGDWLSIHEGWRSDLPTDLSVGTTVEGVARVKGMRNRVAWTVTKSDPPRQLALSGAGKGGTKFDLQFTINPRGDGSTLAVKVEFSGRPFFGPIGSGVARAVKGDVEQALKKFVELYG